MVDGWLPIGCVTSCYALGGMGKSMLAQQIATAVALGVSLFGFQVREFGPVLGLFTEDDDDELVRRQVRINRASSCTMRQLGKLHIQGRAGLENMLVHYSASGLPEPQALLELISKACAMIRPKLLILDNIAQMFGGNENDRSQVSDFCNRLAELARAYDCAVV